MNMMMTMIVGAGRVARRIARPVIDRWDAADTRLATTYAAWPAGDADPSTTVLPAHPHPGVNYHGTIGRDGQLTFHWLPDLSAQHPAVDTLLSAIEQAPVYAYDAAGKCIGVLGAPIREPRFYDPGFHIGRKV